MTSTCQLSRNGSSKTLEEPFVKVEILRRDCPSRSPHFNPLLPCGRRPDELWDRLFSTRFQSTPPVWAETFTIRHLTTSFKFQSTPPVWAETSSFASSFCDILLFQSTPPVWAETPGGGKQAPDRRDFNPLRPCGRRLSLRKFFLHRIWISIHSARVGGDHRHLNPSILISEFQSTPPVWAETLFSG